MLIEYIINALKKIICKIRWRLKNRHNNTWMGECFNADLVNVGNATYGTINVINYSNDKRLEIGHFCSISPGVMFIVCGDHPINCISSFPYKVFFCGHKFEALSKGNIIVEDDVWIGYGSTIMSGVQIGRGAVIAAGSVVTHDIPAYAVVAGVPAKILKYRFSEDIINELNKVDFSKFDKKFICKHEKELYLPVTETSQIDKFMNI